MTKNQYMSNTREVCLTARQIGNWHLIIGDCLGSNEKL